MSGNDPDDITSWSGDRLQQLEYGLIDRVALWKARLGGASRLRFGLLQKQQFLLIQQHMAQAGEDRFTLQCSCCVSGIGCVVTSKFQQRGEFRF